jgi:threonine/homoserine/homoserine lactone efflux protein
MPAFGHLTLADANPCAFGGICATRLPEEQPRLREDAGRRCDVDVGWLVGLTGFAFAMAATPGPNNTMVAASGATYGMTRSLPLTAGIGIGVGSIMLAVAAVGSSVVADPRVGGALKWIGVAYMLWLAWKIARAEPGLKPAVAAEPRKAKPFSFVDGALCQFVNPKLWVMGSGAVVAYGQTSDAGRVSLAILFAFVFGIATFISTLAWMALGASVGRLIHSRRSVRIFNIAMAALLVASLIPVVLQE